MSKIQKDGMTNSITNLRIGALGLMSSASAVSFGLTIERVAEYIKEPNEVMAKLLILPISLFVWSTPIALMLYDNFKRDTAMGLLLEPRVRSRNN